MEDSQIVALYWDRNPDAIDQSKRKYEAYCFTVAHNILGNHEDAEECVNDTWFSAWNAMPPHRPDFLRLFLARLTRGISFDRFRRHTARKRGGGKITAVLDELAECLADETDLEDDIIARELADCVRLFIRALPPREGDVFLRRYFFTESIGEIAGRYGLTPGNTAVILSRTRQKLKLHLTKEGYL